MFVSNFALDRTSFMVYAYIVEYRVEIYRKVGGESPALEFIEGLVKNHRLKALAWMKKIEEHGPNLPRPHADYLEDGIRELRVIIQRHQYRFLYFFHGKVAVVTQGFLKKTDRVPKEEIERAKRHRADWLSRHGG